MTLKSLSRHAAGVMSSPAITVSQTASLAEAATLMIDRDVGCLPVVNRSGALVGMLTERMLQAQLAGGRPASSISFQDRTILELYVGHPGQLDATGTAIEEVRSRTVRDVMDHVPVAVEADAPVWQVAETMMKHHVSHVPIVRERKLVGIVARHELVREVAEQPATGRS